MNPLSYIYNSKILLLFCIFFLSLAISLIFLLFFSSVGPVEHAVPGTDYLVCYKPFALNLLNGEETLPKEGGVICSTPGYPFFLAAVFELSDILKVNELDLIVVFNAVLLAGAAVFLFLIAESVFGKNIGFISSFLWLSYPFNLWLIKNPNTEPPFILLFFVSIWVYLLGLKKNDFKLIFLTGVVLGLSALIRPFALFLPLVFALMIFPLLKEQTKKVRLAFAFLLLLGFLLVILPWEGFELSQSNDSQVISHGGSAMTVGLTYALRNAAGDSWPSPPEDVLALMEKIKAKNIAGAPEALTFLGQELVKNPAPVFKLFLLKVTRAWYATSQMWWERQIAAVQVFYVLLAILGIVFAFRNWREKIPLITFLLSLIVYFWLITLAVLSIVRYMIPVMAVVIIFSAISINLLILKLVKKNYARYP